MQRLEAVDAGLMNGTWQGWRASMGLDNHGSHVDVDPGFKDAGRGDFRAR